MILDFYKSLAEDLRVETSTNFVAKMNVFARQKAGGFAAAPNLPRAISEQMSCIMCTMKGTCLGTSCLGHQGSFIQRFLQDVTLNTKQHQRLPVCCLMSATGERVYNCSFWKSSDIMNHHERIFGFMLLLMKLYEKSFLFSS